MRRSAWIFFASIFLPSLGLAWLAIRSVQDQQVVLEHQQVIISQNITDALAKNVQDQMDAVRADFVKTTQQLLDESASPESLARDFNEKIHATWPMAEIGFAVNLGGEIYSPKLSDNRDALTFRKENDRFLSNRENVEIYSNSLNSQSANLAQNLGAVFAAKTAAAGNFSLNSIATKQEAANDRNEKQTADQAVFNVADKKTKEDSVAQLKSETVDALQKAPSLTLTSPDKSAARLSVAKPLENPMPGVTGGNDIPAPAASTNSAPADVANTATGQRGKDQAKMANAHAQRLDEAADRGRALPAAGGPTAVPAAATPAATLTTTSTAPPSTDASGRSPAAPMADFDAAAATPAPSRNAAVVTTSPMPASAPLPGVVPGPIHATADEEENKPVASNSELPASQAVPQGGVDLIDRVEAKLQKIQRQVTPQKMLSRDSAPVSNTLPADTDFRRAVGADTSGELARFLENKLRLIVWSHATAEAPIVFGAQLDNARLVAALQAALKVPEIDIRTSYDTVSTNYCTAILDDTGHPIALSRPDFVADWKHPFVATEIGEVLPHWEAALYQVDPQQIHHAARTVQYTIALIVLLLVTAILAGGSLIAADVRRQVRLAQQKTDFVSNVSHELKTPLTSIRMFADLLAEKRVPDEEKQATYLRIIAAEASRLTRLINNVLDFARLDRGAKDAAPGEHRACDLVEAVRDVIDTCGPHLETAGVTFRHEIEADSLPIRGDRDALAQIILNLVSNAEKYGGGDILVRARRQETATGALGCIDVLDRGAGIPIAQVRTIFEPFQRLDDSLASGIPGSGLGLTLARRMARAHGGDVTYSVRAGGGSCFTLSIPVAT